METIDLLEGVIPITKAAASLAELIKRAKARRQHIVITQNGYPAAVLLDVESYITLRDLAQRQVERQSEPREPATSG